MEWIMAYLAAAVAFFALDYVWLAKVAKTFYRDRLGALLHDKPNMTVAILFYLLFVVGVIIFAVAPALRDGSWMTALLLGGLFGFFTYATYDLTNLATLKNWPLSVVVVDIAWGTGLTGLTALIGYVGSSAIMSVLV